MFFKQHISEASIFILLLEAQDKNQGFEFFYRFEMDNEVYAISQELMTGSGEDLFDHIASCLANFAKDRKIDKEILPLGFTFSFPCKQKGLAVGELISWTKGFSCKGVEGEDVVTLLKTAINKRNDIHVDVAAILNDTTGCLMSCAWKNHNCRIGLIIGTGTNACYLEDLEKVGEWLGMLEIRCIWIRLFDLRTNKRDAF